jgi:hypothetical protein
VTRRSELELSGALREALRPLVSELVSRELEQRFAAAPATHWLTVEEAAAQRRTTPGAMRARCERGQVPGAVKDGRRWLIPSLDAADTLSSDNKWGERRWNGPAPGTGGHRSHA